MHTCVLVAGNEDIPNLLEPFADYGGEGTNPNGKFDWFKIGGRFGPALPLREPRRLRRFFGLLPGLLTLRSTSAKKCEVDHAALLADPPAALVFAGRWHASRIFAKGDELEAWRKEFATIYAQIPDETKLTVVDCHS